MEQEIISRVEDLSDDDLCDEINSFVSGLFSKTDLDHGYLIKEMRARFEALRRDHNRWKNIISVMSSSGIADMNVLSMLSNDELEGWVCVSDGQISSAPWCGHGYDEDYAEYEVAMIRNGLEP